MWPEGTAHLSLLEQEQCECAVPRGYPHGTEDCLQSPWADRNAQEFPRYVGPVLSAGATPGGLDIHWTFTLYPYWPLPGDTQIAASSSPWHYQYRPLGYRPHRDPGSRLYSAKGRVGRGESGRIGMTHPHPCCCAHLQRTWCLTLPRRTHTFSCMRAARGATSVPHQKAHPAARTGSWPTPVQWATRPSVQDGTIGRWA